MKFVATGTGPRPVTIVATGMASHSGVVGSTGSIGPIGPTGHASSPPDQSQAIQYELCKLDVAAAKPAVVYDLAFAAMNIIGSGSLLIEFDISVDKYLLTIKYKQWHVWHTWQTAVFEIDTLTRDVADVMAVILS